MTSMGKLSADNSTIYFNNKRYSVLLKRVTGSRLYGTQYDKGEHPFDPEYVSDFDFRGLYISDTSERLSIIEKVPEQITIDDGQDTEFYDILKFFTLAIANNPNIMDILFGDKESEIFSNEVGKLILDNKHLFLSQKAKDSFIGYAMKQLYRMKQHHRWNKEYPEIYKVESAIKNAFDNNDIDFQWIADYFSGKLAEKITNQNAQNKINLENTISMEDFISIYNIDFDLKKFIKPHIFNYINVKNKDFKSLNKNIEIKESFFNTAGYSKLNDSIYLIYKNNFQGLFTREGTFKKSSKNTNELTPDYIITINHSDYKKALKEVSSIWEWKVNRNEKRAKLEEKFGYDTKHGMHLFRLLTSAKKLLLTGDYNPRLSGDNLTLARKILSGKIEYNQLISMAENLNKELSDIVSSNKSVLQKEADIIAINNLLQHIYSKY